MPCIRQPCVRGQVNLKNVPCQLALIAYLERGSTCSSAETHKAVFGETMAMHTQDREA